MFQICGLQSHMRSCQYGRAYKSYHRFFKLWSRKEGVTDRYMQGPLLLENLLRMQNSVVQLQAKF